MLIHNLVPTPPWRFWFPPRSSAGSVIEDSEVARNGQGDEDPEDPQTINEVCVATSALIIVENLT